jgi:hypothetical protein
MRHSVVRSISKVESSHCSASLTWGLVRNAEPQALPQTVQSEFWQQVWKLFVLSPENPTEALKVDPYT